MIPSILRSGISRIRGYKIGVAQPIVRNPIHLLLLVSCTLLACATIPVSALPIVAVNLSQTEASPDETGFTNWLAADNSGPVSTTINSIGISVRGNLSDVAANGFRSVDRTASYNGTLAKLTETWWAARAGTSIQGGVFTITISGLLAGSYDWTSWHHDHSDQKGIMTIAVSVNGGTSFTDQLIGFAVVNGNSASAPNPATFRFTANGSQDVVIRFTNTASGGTPPNSGTLTVVNGFQIESIPQGSITYADADITAGTGNTVLAGGGTFGPTQSTAVVADGLWSIRTRPAVNGGGILASNAGENATPRLATTFTLPGPGLYTLCGYFWNNVSGTGIWDANFQVGTVRPAVTYDKSNSVNLGQTSNHFNNPAIAVNDATGQVMHEAKLATWNTATEGLTVTVFIDDPETGPNDDRTWYDGIGFSPSALNLSPGVDTDNDGLDNMAEVNIHGTDPTIADTDGDSYQDGMEITNNTNPLVPDEPLLPPGLPSGAVRIQNDGAWSWFNDHTARFVNGDLYVGYVKGQARKMAMTRYDFDTDTAHEFLLGTQPSNDDHDVPTVTVLPDGRILTTYSRHGVDQSFYYRRSLNGNPTSLADWGAEQSKSAGANNTYCNTFRLSGESNKIYNFVRAINFNPTVFTSSDHGQTWSAPSHFIDAGTGGVRPYPRYATNHENRIDLIYTDGHPRNVNNSIYHLYYQGGNFRRSDGSVVKSFAALPLDHDAGERGSVVYPYTAAAWGAGDGPDDWIPSGRAWTWDIQYQADGKPVCAFQVQVDGVTGPATDFKNDRIYYYYARWDGSQWRRKFIANAGRGLFTSEDDYGGGMSIDPENPNVVYISSNVANPFDLTTLAPALNPNNEIHEIYRGTTADGGDTWTWEAITSNSVASNMRPFVPEDHGRSLAVVWFHGRYTTYLNYDCDVFGLFSAPIETGLRIRNAQWTPGGAAFKWASIPGKTYRIAASTDLVSFPIDIARGISAQGDSTYQTFNFPPAVSGSQKLFFRVEEE
jgi:hypothetical protein